MYVCMYYYDVMYIYIYIYIYMYIYIYIYRERERGRYIHTTALAAGVVHACFTLPPPFMGHRRAVWVYCLRRLPPPPPLMGHWRAVFAQPKECERQICRSSWMCR